MSVVPLAFDCETCLFRPGSMAPELVCVTWQRADENIPTLVRHTEAERLIGDWLEDTRIILTGANTAYDLRVAGANYPDLVPAIFRAYEENRVTDVQIRQQILDIAAGRFQWFEGRKPKYSLDDLSYRYFQERLAEKGGPDAWRLRYGELRDTLFPWPERATVYPLKDASRTLEIHMLQEEHSDWLNDQFRVSRNIWWLGLQSAWGLRTNPGRVEAFERKTVAARDAIRARLVASGLVRPDGSRDTKAAKAMMVQVCTELGRDVALTETGNVALDADACDQTEHPTLVSYADFTRLGTTLNKDIKALKHGTRWPIHTRYNLAATSRITSSGPNIQNWGTAPGPRECFEPRPGWVFADNDYPSLELFTLAETCMRLFGVSKLADALNAGRDPHSEMAARILGMAYEDVLRNKLREDVYLARQTGKVFNFGKPGGLGATSLVEYARALYGVILSEEQARYYGGLWLEQYPEMREYFGYINSLTAASGDRRAVVEIPGTDWIRGDCSYCAACNTNFQGLGAHCACRAGWLIAKACYVDRTSPLFGSRPVAFIHDQFITEVREGDGMHEAAVEQARLMLDGANHYLQHVPIKKSDPTLMRYWSKESFATKRGGRLVPWAGEWICDECNGVFVPPAPAPKQRKCAGHTVRFDLAA